MENELLGLLAARTGHFRLESGHHGDLWLDLDPLFLRPTRLRGFAAALASRFAAYDVEAICGPLNGGAFVAQLIAAELGVAFSYTERHAPTRTDALYAVEYRLPAGLRGPIGGKTVAIVDDVINAGSAVRATYAALRACGARPIALGALLVLGGGAARFAADSALPLEYLSRRESHIWIPSECPLCAANVPLVDMA